MAVFLPAGVPTERGIAILDSEGNAVVEYSYDAWGKLLATTGTLAATIGLHNPLRYRGYVYDNETALYYLQSRYYDPELGRFINADAFASTGTGLLGYNMFAYCNNNPANRSDPKGTIPFYDSPIQKAIDDFAKWYRDSSEYERDSNGHLTLNAKIKRSVQAVERNIVATAGIGLGMYGGIIATEYANLDIGMHYDLCRIELSKGTLDIYQYYYEGVEANLLFILGEGSQNQEIRRDISGAGPWRSVESPDVVSMWGIGGYFFAGGCVAIGIDVASIKSELCNVWGQ